MDLALLFRGMLVGAAIAVPVGPIGVLCVRRSILKGPVSGLVSGFGAAVADALFGCIAAFGLTQLADALIEHQGWLKLAGSGFLCLLGVRSLVSDPRPPRTTPNNGSLAGDFVSTFLLTLTNPVTILAFAAIFAAIGVIGQELEAADTLMLVAGVFVGSAAWWLLLTGVTTPFRERLDPNHLEWIARVAGIILLASGFYVLASLVWPHLL